MPAAPADADPPEPSVFAPAELDDWAETSPLPDAEADEEDCAEALAPFPEPQVTASTEMSNKRGAKAFILVVAVSVG
jgi:hypothetical protein